VLSHQFDKLEKARIRGAHVATPLLVDDVILKRVEIVAAFLMAVECREIDLIFLEAHFDANAGAGEANENVVWTGVQKIIVNAIPRQKRKKRQKARQAGLDVHDKILSRL
jgi:hypothetical protein